MEVPRRVRGRIASVIAAAAAAAFPIWLAREHWTAEWPWAGDAVSMVLPTALARRAIASGRLPLSSPLYFQGESLLNPHSQLLYPPWWVTLGPLSLGDALKIVLAAHFAAAPLVAFWYARRADLPVPLAGGIAVAAAIPLAGLSGHHQKVLGWPWLLLAAGQLLPWEWENGRRAGAVIGVAGGALLLASSLYYAFYAAALVAPMFLLYRERERWAAAVAGAALGLPAIVLDILPYLGAPRPGPGYWLTPRTLLTGIVGLAPGKLRLVDGFQVSGVPFEGFAAVGGAVLLLGTVGLYRAIDDGRGRWVTGILAGGTLGVWLASNPLVYRLPVVDTFRTAGRASVMVALVLLVLAIYACRSLLARPPAVLSGFDSVGRRRAAAVVLGVLLLVNTGVGVVAYERMDWGNGTDLAESESFAASLPDDCGRHVWAEMYTANGSLPRGHLGMAMLHEGYRLDAVYYAAFGASYDARYANGTLRFDLLLSPTRLNGTTPLTGGDAQLYRGSVNRSELRYLTTREYRGESVSVYARRGACTDAA